MRRQLSTQAFQPPEHTRARTRERQFVGRLRDGWGAHLTCCETSWCACLRLTLLACIHSFPCCCAACVPPIEAPVCTLGLTGSCSWGSAAGSVIHAGGARPGAAMLAPPYRACAIFHWHENKDE